MGWLVWDPDRNIFTLPFIGHPITWYGFLFALGFFLSYLIIKFVFKVFLDANLSRNDLKNSLIYSLQLTDRLTVLVILGTIVGARLGHVFFYEWSYYKKHLIDILKVWEGGLASHGAVIGILIALFIFTIWSQKTIKQMRFLVVLDAIVIPIPLTGALIRIGNFINQEILGTPTDLPWGVIFVHPIEGIKGVPLHPVQIYEALFYLLVFVGLFFYWKKKPQTLGRGRLAGLFFILIFGFRYIIEFIKLPQSDLINESKYGNMGQLLSIPFVLLGIGLFFFSYRRSSK